MHDLGSGHGSLALPHSQMPDGWHLCRRINNAVASRRRLMKAGAKAASMAAEASPKDEWMADGPDRPYVDESDDEQDEGGSMLNYDQYYPTILPMRQPGMEEGFNAAELEAGARIPEFTNEQVQAHHRCCGPAHCCHTLTIFSTRLYDEHLWFCMLAFMTEGGPRKLQSLRSTVQDSLHDPHLEHHTGILPMQCCGGPPQLAAVFPPASGQTTWLSIACH